MKDSLEDPLVAASQQDVTIDELREEVRIVHSRIDNNSDVKRYAGMARARIQGAVEE